MSLVATFLLTVFAARSDGFVFTPINVSHGLSDNQIRYILQLSDGRMVFTTSGNVNLYDGAGFTYIHRTSAYIYTLTNYDGFYRVYEGGDSLLWIKDHYKLLCIDLHKEKYVLNIDSCFSRFGIQTPVDNLFVDSSKDLWLCTGNSLVCTKTLDSIDIADSQGKLQDVESDDNCIYLFYDTGEVVCYHKETKELLCRIAAYPPAEAEIFRNTSLVKKEKNGFFQLRNGRKGGFFFFDTRNRNWKKLLETDYMLNTLTLDPDGIAYISTVYGIWEIDPKSGESKHLSSLTLKDGRELDTEISTLFYDAQGGFWLGTLNQGLLYHHPFRYKLKNIGRSSFPLHSNKEIIVHTFAEDDRGNIFLRCKSDYYQYRPLAKDDQTVVSVVPESIPAEVVKKLNKQTGRQLFQGEYYTSVCTDKRGWTWGGTPDGLVLFRPGQAKKIFHTEDGLVNNFVHALLEDRNHAIWITTSYGISQILVDSTGNKINFTNYNSYEGTLEGEYVNSSIYEAADGSLYFGGVNGFTVFPASDSASFTFLPYKPVFTSLIVQGEKIKIDESYNGRILLNQSTIFTDAIELAHTQNTLAFEFSALNFRNSAQTYYRYRLEGIDTDWNEKLAAIQTNDNGMLKISYTNLPPGKYKLMVSSSDNYRRWNSDKRTIDITIHAPWWKTKTAYALYLCFLLLLIVSVIRFYLYLTKKKIERQHKEEILLLRIKNLIEQSNQYEEEQRARSESSVSDNVISPNEERLNPADEEFLNKAMRQVEKNIDVSGYSVEQLSRDLCMDRTGLYRRLIQLLDQSPSLFIRNIRLQRAAQLIREDELTLAEIANRVGFSSHSYLTKCFQELYGCRPSEYAEKVKNHPG